MLKIAAAGVALLGFVGSALGQMTLLGDERYTDYRIGVFDFPTLAEADGHESTLIGQPFVSSLSDFVAPGNADGGVVLDQDSSVTGDLISADLSAVAQADVFGANVAVSSLARSRLNVVFSVAAPTPYDFAVTSWSEGGALPSVGEATARLEWADGSGVIENLVGVSSASGVLAPGEYRLVLDVVAFTVGPDFGSSSENASLIATFSVPATPSACSEADVTTQGAGSGDPLFGIPDGIMTAADINYYVNLWVAGCP